MMTRKATLAACLLLGGLAPGARAQFGAPSSPFSALPGASSAIGGGVPGVGTAAGIPAAGVPAGVPAAGGGQTLWGFFGLSKANCAACRAKLCQSQLGMMLNSGTRAFGGLSGGLVPSLCPPITAADLAGSPNGPNGAQSVAAKIKADEAQAKARVAAVEYLGTVDCHYWPDAEAALIERLRTDRNECVRFAAARVLGSGCCCTKNTVAALTITMTGSDEDGNPSETSERVRATAFRSLQSCQGRVRLPEPTPPELPEGPARPENPDGVRQASYESPGVVLTSFYTHTLKRKPMVAVVAESRRALAAFAAAPRGERILVTGDRSVFGALSLAAAPAAPVAVAAAPAPDPSARLRPIPRGDVRLLAHADPSVTPAVARPVSGRSVNAGAPPTGSRSLIGILKSSMRPRSSAQ